MNRLQGKDLINIGIFTAIYFIVIFAAASIGFIPIFIPLISVIVPLVGGIPMMLFFSKIKKFGMLTICGLLLGVIMLLIPGAALTNAVRDMLVGHTVSGLLRMFESLLLALMLAIGFGSAIYLFGV